MDAYFHDSEYPESGPNSSKKDYKMVLLPWYLQE